VKINGIKGEKVAAEMLVSMYDASLTSSGHMHVQARDMLFTTITLTG
jgi:hypothetical protein